MQLGFEQVSSVAEARRVTNTWLEQHLHDHRFIAGFPERDDRIQRWRIPVMLELGRGEPLGPVGELTVDWLTGHVSAHTDPELFKARAQRLEGEQASPPASLHRHPPTQAAKRQPRPKLLPNSIVLGDAATVLNTLPDQAAQLVITSPPYFNLRPEYADYVDYDEYLTFLANVFRECHRVLDEGRFFILNSSPVLLRRASRQHSSKRIPLPFDLHHVVSQLGFDYVDDIIWVKPEGAGWTTGRGRRFAADRNPLQYKPVPVTEYFFVYRKHTDKLIDWNIRTHHDPKLVEESKIDGEYDVTNVWYSTPAHNSEHPAVFPEALIKKLIRYYSFKQDLVLDPFAGSGTVGKAAISMNRRFFLIDRSPQYFDLMRREVVPLAEAVKMNVTVTNPDAEAS
jgi:DNA modification methylase